jgi:hypothetical protein
VLDSLLTNLINYITQGPITQDMELIMLKSVLKDHLYFHLYPYSISRETVCKNLVGNNVEFCIRKVFNPFNVA